ncbi:hypothetical protein [Simkania sp.]|uniref:hypothetical protein n=1 Tax=Simkania sp. TaxID=34094 RepID=UPI003B515A97
MHQLYQNTNKDAVTSMTYNLRIQEANDTGAQSWQARESAILDMISGKVSNEGKNFDFAALQECGTHNGTHTWAESIYDAMTNKSHPHYADFEKLGMLPAPSQGVPNSDNLIIYDKTKWTVEKTESFGLNSHNGTWYPNTVLGADFIQSESDPYVQSNHVYVFAGHLPTQSGLEKYDGIMSLQQLMNDVSYFVGADGSQNWAATRQIFILLDSNCKGKLNDGTNNPLFDQDPAAMWAGFHDIYYENVLHKASTPQADLTDHAWPIEKGVPKTPLDREDLQFVSGFDPSESNTSAVIHYKYTYTDPNTGQTTTLHPSDHLAVVNKTYFKGLVHPTLPKNELATSSQTP